MSVPFIVPPVQNALVFIFLRGEVGVSIFFVLSGCLLAMPFWSHRVNGTPKPKLMNFARNRLARIAPAFWLALIVSTFAGAWAFHTPVNWVRFFSGLTFTNGFYYKTLFPSDYDGVLWSIGFEVFCYAVLPFIIFSIFKLSKTVRGTAIGLLIWIAFLQGLQPLIIKYFMTGFAFKGWQWGLIGGAKIWMPYWNPICFLSQFLIGSAAALVIVVERKNHYLKSWVWDIICVVAGIGAFALVCFREIPGAPDNFTHQPYVSPFYAILIAIALAAAASSALMYRLLDNRFFRYVARISFGLYLWHLFIITVMQQTIAKDFYSGGLPDVFRWLDDVLLAYGLAWAVAAMSYRYFEKPILDYNRSRLARVSVDQPVVPIPL